MFLREHTEAVSVLPGVGPGLASLFARLDIRTVADLLTHYPRAYEDRTVIHPLAEAVGRGETAVAVSVTDHVWIGPPRRKTLKILVRDESAEGCLVCYNRAFLARALPVGARAWLWGSFAARAGVIESTRFEHELWSERPRSFLRILPVYGATAGLGQGAIRRTMAAALDRVLPDLEDEMPRAVLDPRGLEGTRAALRAVHVPPTREAASAARRALAFEELAHLNLAIARRSAAGPACAPDERTRAARRHAGALREELIRRLPFQLTSGQRGALEEITRDLRAPRPMRRLLQGDVGCGKTLVALLAALDVIQAGEQVALMAPTELLARQHAESAARYLEPLGVRVGLLVSGVAGGARQRLLHALGSPVGAPDAPRVDIVVGTHALFSPDVIYRDLGLAVIDEQQRFGVVERRELARKGNEVDLLQMTATPIPRSLALTVFGDLEITEIRGMPEGRKSVATHLARTTSSARVYERVGRELERGRQAYFVYPVIAATGGLRDAQRMYDEIRNRIYPKYTCALSHSRIPEDQKAERMASFASGETSVLGATSVVEVGVDVPNATCMVVEHAERFGLSALHQLRGRVGRGAEQSYVFLVYGEDLTAAGVGRLRVMKETGDGFRIAEEDLKLRGPGAFAGVEQAGYLKLGIADPLGDTEMMLDARSCIRGILAKDTELGLPEHAALRAVLARAPRFQELGEGGGAGEG